MIRLAAMNSGLPSRSKAARALFASASSSAVARIPWLVMQSSTISDSGQASDSIRAFCLVRGGNSPEQHRATPGG
jgi:hypothetical protein